MKSKNFTRKELYDLVWSEPLAAIAKRFDTSDYILRKACKDFKIPLPKAGHWMKIQFGKPVKIELLDESYMGQNDVSLSEMPIPEIKILPSLNLSPFEALKVEIENDKRVSLFVPERLSGPDKMIELLKKELENRTGYSSEGYRIKSFDNLNVLVTKDHLGRALRFMDTLIKAIKARGHDISVRNRKTLVLIYSVEIEISCREKATRVKISDKPYNNTELRSTGILSFNIEGFYIKEWKDGKVKLEEQLSNIIAKLELEGKKRQEENMKWQKIRDENDRKAKMIKDIQKSKEKQLEDFKTLITNSRKHREVRLIREYIAAVEQNSIESGELTDEIKNWIEWAKNKTNWYDPFLNHPDPDLDEVDKDSLTFKKANRLY
jgi:hypothetical protein